jgi:hypothetical protein
MRAILDIHRGVQERYSCSAHAGEGGPELRKAHYCSIARIALGIQFLVATKNRKVPFLQSAAMHSVRCRVEKSRLLIWSRSAAEGTRGQCSLTSHSRGEIIVREATNAKQFLHLNNVDGSINEMWNLRRTPPLNTKRSCIESALLIFIDCTGGAHLKVRDNCEGNSWCPKGILPLPLVGIQQREREKEKLTTQQTFSLALGDNCLCV